MSSTDQPVRYTEHQHNHIHNDGPIHRPHRDFGSRRPEGEEPTDDAVSDRDNCDRDTKAAQFERTPSKIGVGSCQSLPQHDGRGDGEG